MKPVFRTFAALIAALAFAGAGALAAVDEGPGGGAETLEPVPDRIDELFDELRDAPGGFEASVIEQTLLSVLAMSGSATADLLMDRSASVFLEEDFELALELLDRVIDMKPDFAEAWHRRSQVHFAMEDYSSAMADLQEVLRLEPRHFIAIRTLGFALLEAGHPAGALKAFRMALELNPHMEDVRQEVTRLEVEVEGRNI